MEENKNIKFSPTLRRISQLQSSILAAAYMSNISTQTLVGSFHIYMVPEMDACLSVNWICSIM